MVQGLDTAGAWLGNRDGLQGSIVGDFNGDGKADFIVWHRDVAWEAALYLADAKTPGKFNRADLPADLKTRKLGGGWSGAPAEEAVETIAVDINGDGRADLIRSCKSTNTARCPLGRRDVTMWLSLLSSDGAAPLEQPAFVATASDSLNAIPDTLYSTRDTLNIRCTSTDRDAFPSGGTNRRLDLFNDVFWQDFDGDGFIDLVIVESNTTPAVTSGPRQIPGALQCPSVPDRFNNRFKRFRYYTGAGDGTFALRQTITSSVATPIFNDHRTKDSVAGLSTGEVVDVNGDGRPDLLFVASRWIQQPSGTFEERSNALDLAGLSEPQMQLIDINGDGRQDIVLVETNPAARYTVQCNGDPAVNFEVSANPGSSALFINTGVGPAGGAAFRRDDRPIAQLKSEAVYRFCSGGRQQFAFGNGPVGSIQTDLDGNGLADFLAWSNAGNQDANLTRFRVAPSPGAFGFPAIELQAVPHGLPTNLVQQAGYVGGDFLGIGGPSFTKLPDAGGPNGTVYGRLGPPNDVMVEAVSPSRGSTLVRYASLATATDAFLGNPTVSSGVYAPTRPPVTAATVAAHTWPLYHAHPPQWVVSGTTQPNGGGVGVVTAFVYSGQKADLSGGGSLGFESVSKYFPYADGRMMVSTTEYLQPVNSATSLDGFSQRKGYAGMPKCTFTRYQPNWSSNAPVREVIEGDGELFDPRGRNRVVRKTAQSMAGGAQKPSTANAAALDMSTGVNSLCFDSDTKPGDAYAENIVNMTTYTYCDVQQQGQAGAATIHAPCASASAIKRPYQYRSVERTWDLNQRNMLVSRVDTRNDSMTQYGDVLTATARTTGFGVGGFAGEVTHTKSTENEYDLESTFIDGTKWFLGRLTKSRVTSTSSTAGVAPRQDNSGLTKTARATSGAETPPTRVLRPEELAAILQLLLDD
ncbi:hypothetical protein IP84_07050 [beta proteobacterium AAP99]|nr:hypothetical protein IP84_07050 [beta proteobacterium AAP99]